MSGAKASMRGKGNHRTPFVDLGPASEALAGSTSPSWMPRHLFDTGAWGTCSTLGAVDEKFGTPVAYMA